MTGRRPTRLRWIGVMIPVILILAATVHLCAAPIDGVVVIDADQRFQTMLGWEATAFAAHHQPIFEKYKDDLFDAAVNELGINRVRLEVRAGTENPRDYWSELRANKITWDDWRRVWYTATNDNADPRSVDPSGFHWSEMDFAVEQVVQPLKRRLEARGEKLWINACYVAFTHVNAPESEYAHADAEEYAEFVEATYQHLHEKYGWVPDSWEVILEPDNRVKQWNGTTIGHAIVAAAARLQKHGWTPRFVAPSCTNMTNAVRYFDALRRVPGALEHLMELSYHRYGRVSKDVLRAIAGRGREHGLQTAHLERMGATYKALHDDLTLANVSSWSQYALGGPGKDSKGVYYFIDVSNPAQPRVQLGSRGRYLRQYFQYVRRGAVRIGASTDESGLLPVAFLNADGRAVVIVAATRKATIRIQGLPSGRYGVSYSVGGEQVIASEDSRVGGDGRLNLTIPNEGVLTAFALPR